MNLKHFSILAILGVSTICSSFAQIDTKAKAILDELSAKTKAYTTIKAEFEYVIEKKDKTKDSQKGKIQIKGNKYRLDIPGHEIFCDGKTVWDFIKDANEVQIKNMETGGEDALNPTTIFTLYEKGYKYKFEGEDAATQTITLYPLNPDKKKFHTVKLVIDKTKKQIISVKMLMKDGTIQTYTISSFLGNGTIQDSDFVFDKTKHPGIDVEDLR